MLGDNHVGRKMKSEGTKLVRYLIDPRRFLDVRPGEAGRIALMAAFLFFLLAANNLIKVVRDALFLSRFPITQLPYVYLLAALAAAAVTLVYSRFSAKLPFLRVVLLSLAAIIANVILFWLLITFIGAGWVLYAYYIWSAIVGLIMVAQFWTLANEMFTPRDGKRLFGLITAGGTLGGMAGGIMANWAVSLVFGTNQLLWLVAALFAGAYGVARVLLRKRAEFVVLNRRQDESASATATPDTIGVVGTVLGSRYLQTIGAVIFVSVVVSTLIDYQFKAMTKETFPSADALASFFGSYYAWLSLVTLLAQVWLTGKVLLGLGLTPSLLILPVALLAGSIGLLAWPGLVAATATRMAEASLRTSINQSGLQILYLPVPDSIKKKVKVFMDVTMERLGDGVAALIILSFTLLLGWSEVKLLNYFSVGLIIIWIAIVLTAHKGYVDTLRRSLAYRDISLETTPIDFTDEATVDAVLSDLDGKDEPSILFALALAERMESQLVVAHLPRGLLSHPSAEVRRRVLTLVAASLEPTTLAMVFELLAAENSELRGEAINTVATVLKEAAIPVIRPFLNSPQIQTRRAAIHLVLQSGDVGARREALAAFRELMTDRSLGGESKRIEAARLMGDISDPEFSGHLRSLIRDDPSPTVIREAMAAAARGKFPGLIQDVISRLGGGATKGAAHEALAQYGEMAVKNLRNALFDDRVSRDIRRNVPRTLSKIHAQSAMNALLAGLLEEDRVLRFKVILAIEEMARRFVDLKVDRAIVESAILSDALLYCHRLVIFVALFSDWEQSSLSRESLLYHTLRESMDRVVQRITWLLALVYPDKDIRRAWSGLKSANPLQRAHATEFLDNLLAGNVKKYVFPLFSDSQPDQRLRAALDALGIGAMDTDSALRALLAQDDRWLKTATVWEIGIRKLRQFGPALAKLTRSDDAVLRETANKVIQGDLVS